MSSRGHRKVGPSEFKHMHFHLVEGSSNILWTRAAPGFLLCGSVGAEPRAQGQQQGMSFASSYLGACGGQLGAGPRAWGQLIAPPIFMDIFPSFVVFNWEGQPAIGQSICNIQRDMLQNRTSCAQTCRAVHVNTKDRTPKYGSKSTIACSIVTHYFKHCRHIPIFQFS